MAIEKVFMAGAGIMGHGIAQVCAQGGLEVFLCDVNEDLVSKGLARIEKGLARAVDKGKMSAQDKDGILARITGTTDLEKAADAQIVIEAIVENVAVKKEVYAKLDTICGPEVLFASNTSSMSITEMAAATARPDRFIGMHFFNPVPVMKLVEIIRGLLTSEETFAAVRDLAVKLGKTPIDIKDSPGFASTRILMMLVNEAIFSYWEGLGSAEDIDTALKLGANHPMGPLALADLIGLDVVLNVMNRLYTGFCDSKYRPCPLLVNMVAAGLLGRKTGRGFYAYDK